MPDISLQAAEIANASLLPKLSENGYDEVLGIYLLGEREYAYSEFWSGMRMICVGKEEGYPEGGLTALLGQLDNEKTVLVPLTEESDRTVSEDPYRLLFRGAKIDGPYFVSAFVHQDFYALNRNLEKQN